MNHSMHPEAVAGIAFVVMFGIISLIVLVITVLTVIIWCKIFSKAGYSWAMGLLMLVPIANLVMMLVLAFSDWPVQRELRLLKQPRPSVQVPPG
jgi:hypothetical protein